MKHSPQALWTSSRSREETKLDDQWERQFISTVKLVTRIKVITHPRARLSHLGRPPSKSVTLFAVDPQTKYRVIAIGASTGGPAAIVHVLRALPPAYPLPILLVLHIGEPFGTAFADWLDGQTNPCGSHMHEMATCSAMPWAAW